jgi:hypothetical protein
MRRRLGVPDLDLPSSTRTGSTRTEAVYRTYAVKWQVHITMNHDDDQAVISPGCAAACDLARLEVARYPSNGYRYSLL